MARRMRISAAAVALMAVSTDASAFTWQQRRNAWYPPTETLVARDIMEELGWRSLEPTPAPVLREAIPEIIKRQTNTDNTCGYVSGISESSLYCNVDSMCVYNSGQSVVGCCPNTSTNCDLVSTCLDAADGSSILARGSTIGSETMWCDYTSDFTSYPSCVTHLYGDSGLDGYSLFGCGILGGTDTILYTANSDASTSGRGSASTDVDDNIATATSTAPGSDETGNGGGGSSSGGKKKKSNTGAIVGGVVGGVAALAVVAIAGFFKAKKKKQESEENKMASPPMANIPPAAPPVTTFPPQSPMPGQPPMAVNNMGAPTAMYPPPGPGSPPLQQQGAHIPSMYSVGPVSPGTDYTSSGYPSGTSSTHPMMSPPLPPPSVSPQPQQMYAQPPYGQQSPPPPQPGYGAAWNTQPPPPHQQQQQQPPQQGFVAELSTEKGHGEVRELPG